MPSNEISINKCISYIACSEDPLSADIGIIRSDGETWLFDVGNDLSRVTELKARCNVVLSHFHQDHTGSLGALNINKLYVSGETLKHTCRGIKVSDDLYIGSLHIFPLPSSHCKGCLALEVDETYAFVGDALYCKVSGEYYVFNAQMLKSEIDTLSRLKAPYLLVSHHPGLIRDKAEAIEELRQMSELRAKKNAEILIKR